MYVFYADCLFLQNSISSLSYPICQVIILILGEQKLKQLFLSVTYHVKTPSFIKYDVIDLCQQTILMLVK